MLFVLYSEKYFYNSGEKIPGQKTFETEIRQKEK